VPDFDALYPGRFLKGRVLERPRVIRIVSVTGAALEGEKGMKATGILKYKGNFSIKDGRLVEGETGTGEIVWNKSNSALTAAALSERNYEKWANRLIAIWFDPAVEMGKEAVGGIRVYGSPEMKTALRVEIPRPRRRTPDVYMLYPTDNAGNRRDAKQTAKQAAPQQQQSEPQRDPATGEVIPPVEP
jgi:hypothetical protein